MFRKLIYSLVMFLSVASLVTPITAHAEGYMLDNDGTAYDEPIGNSGLPPSFSDAKYYDCYIPYQLTPKDIGGYANRVIAYAKEYCNATMAQTTIDTRKMGSYINYEFDRSTWSYGGTMSHESDTGCCIVTDNNGTKYYVCAIQKFFYNSSSVGSEGFPGWGIENRGQIFDAILTDGTIIHFAVGDANAEAHTNGGPMEETLWEVQWGFADMIYPQYTNLYAAVAGNQVEIWGQSDCASKFSNKYNIGTGEGQNQIAYYRMYNKKTSDSPSPVAETVNKSSWKFDVNGVTSKGNGGGSDGNGITITGSSLYEESHFIGDFAGLTDEHLIVLPDGSNLYNWEQQEIANWKNTIELLQEDKKFSFLRAIVMFVGILMIVYSTVLFLAFQFDRINNFVDIELVSYITLGKLITSRDETSTYNKEGERGKPKAVVQKDIAMATITGISAGVLLLSGKLYAIISLVVSLVQSIF